MVKGKGVLELMAKKHEKKHQALELEPFTMFYPRISDGTPKIGHIIYIHISYINQKHIKVIKATFSRPQFLGFQIEFGAVIAHVGPLPGSQRSGRLPSSWIYR